MKNLEATKLARKALRKACVNFGMYTNRYGKSRTVKAYIGTGAKDRAAVIEALLEAFGEHDMPVVDIHSTRRSYPWSADEVTAIVRLPYSKYGE